MTIALITNKDLIQESLDRAKQDLAEAAELQSWLVVNATAFRPAGHVGLMAWALAALKACTDTNTSGKAHCPSCAVCHTSEETCVNALKRFNAVTLRAEGGV